MFVQNRHKPHPPRFHHISTIQLSPSCPPFTFLAPLLLTVPIPFISPHLLTVPFLYHYFLTICLLSLHSVTNWECPWGWVPLSTPKVYSTWSSVSGIPTVTQALWPQIWWSELCTLGLCTKAWCVLPTDRDCRYCSPPWMECGLYRLFLKLKYFY